MSLPWDRYPADHPAPEPVPDLDATKIQTGLIEPDQLPELPYQPVSDGVLEEAFQQALNDALPWLREQAFGYAKTAWNATSEGKSVDILHPTVTATTSQGRELLVADARNRSWRTFLQGLGIDLIYAIIALLGTLTNIDPLDKASWVIFGVLVIKTLIQTVIAYVMRLKITPTVKIPDASAEGRTKVALMPLPVPVPEKSKAQEP